VAHRVVWSPRAADDLVSIAEYIEADSPAYAEAVVRKIIRQAQILRDFPRAGRRVAEFSDDNTRELIVFIYRVIYRIEADQVLVAAIVHGKRILG